MANKIKLPVFHGNGFEDPEQHLFLCDVVWGSKQIQDDDVKKGHLMTTFSDRALTWFMKYYDPSLPAGTLKTFVEIHTTLKNKFKKLKSES